MCDTSVIRLSPSAMKSDENNGKGEVRPKCIRNTEKFGRVRQLKINF